jgi:signal transduction histidine kinase
LAKEAALQQLALKSNFLSDMSHEIRTPLSSIIGFSEILCETNLDQEQKQYASTVHRCSKALLHLVNNILDISKIESGQLEVDHHRFDIRELHQDICRMFSLSCSEKGLDLQLVIDPAIPHHVVGDSHRLRQVLVNLVSNAIKFTDKGVIKIEVRADENLPVYHWQVRDTGRGIHAENLGNLFRSFYQEDASVSRRYGGTGLGLTISKNLVEIMGGEISVASRPGEGTVFSFSLPMSLP